MICLSSSLFNMTALVLSPKYDDPNDNIDPVIHGSANGSYEFIQNPISGAMERVWVPAPGDDGNTNTNPLAGPVAGRRVECVARGILEGGIRVTSTTERYSTRGTLEIGDFINFEFPPNEVITRRDRITDIRDRHGNLIWIEEESTNRPTIFEVTGVTPVTDPFGMQVKNFSLLSRAQDQESLWRDLSLAGAGELESVPDFTEIYNTGVYEYEPTMAEDVPNFTQIYETGEVH